MNHKVTNYANVRLFVCVITTKLNTCLSCIYLSFIFSNFVFISKLALKFTRYQSIRYTLLFIFQCTHQARVSIYSAGTKLMTKIISVHGIDVIVTHLPSNE
uniref:Uncharacterized protein n=1 Tax=Cacopsylla melanoneura TaxID=428564 RepID=A0A8D9BVP2_9HEMI